MWGQLTSGCSPDSLHLVSPTANCLIDKTQPITIVLGMGESRAVEEKQSWNKPVWIKSLAFTSECFCLIYFFLNGLTPCDKSKPDVIDPELIPECLLGEHALNLVVDSEE